MGEFVNPLPLLAQTKELDGLRGVRDGFIQQAFQTNIFGILLTAVGLCLLAFMIDRLWRQRQRRNEPKVVDYLTTAGRQIGLSLAEVLDKPRDVPAEAVEKACQRDPDRSSLFVQLTGE